MIDSLHTTLASALSLMPCTCSFAGSWPTFKVEACIGEKAKHRLKTCTRCTALEAYEIRKSVHDAAHKEAKP